MHKLSREQVVYSLSPENKAVLKINNGETVVFETEDCFSNQIRDENQNVGNEFNFDKVNPATGPIFINGLKPGDTMYVKIKRIKLAAQGVVEAIPNFGLLGGSVKNASTKILRISGNNVMFNNIEFDATPMIGVIGVSPKKENISCGIPGCHGGNLDTVEITEGSTVYLPVFHEGGLLSMGDVHALMGDGEICGTGLECRAEVEVEAGKKEAFPIEEPVVETEDKIFFLASDEDLKTASKNALEYCVNYLKNKYSLSFEDSYMLCSLIGNLGISQIVNPVYTVKFSVPKTIDFQEH